MLSAIRFVAISLMVAIPAYAQKGDDKNERPGGTRTAAAQPAADSLTRVALDIVQGGQPWGTIVLELEDRKAPQTVANFLRYVDDGYFDGTLIHRVVTGPRIHVFQGGGYTALGATTKPGQHPPIKNEAANGLKNVRGTIAMARDREPHTANSEFFVNTEDNPKLDYTGEEHWGYCVFGHVIEGMDVVERIRVMETRVNPEPELKGEKSQPVNPAVVKKASRVVKK